MLIHFGIVPYIVFDGDYLPSKSSTEIERASKREESRRLGLELQRLGRTSQARLELQKAVDVTPEMAGQFIEKLKILGVKYLVAPYEADAQLAYLERKGMIDAILSEDSDLLVFGAKCLLTKLDQYGDCVEINRKDFTACRDISLVGWSDTEFRCMAILSGCDYLPSISGMGLKTAYQLVRKYRSIDRIVRDLAFSKRYQLPARYQESFRRADLTFLHQRVFCPIMNNIVMMTSFGPGPEPEDFNFIGSDLEQDVAIGVSTGELHPMTKKPMALKMNAPLTPSKGLEKQHTTRISTPFSQMKGNESIQAFFKTKRTPLAELDPNTFTPSSSQRRLLQQSSRAWMPSPAPARLPSNRLGESAAASAFTSASSTEHPTTLHRANRSPQACSHSPKRRRLCSEQDEGQDIQNTSAGSASSTRSRYFAASRPKAVSLIDVGKSSKSRKQAMDPEIQVWSDNCIDKVMAGCLPDFSNRPPPGRRVLRVAGTDNQDVLIRSSCTQVHKENSFSAASEACIHSGSSINSNVIKSTAVTRVEQSGRSNVKLTSNDMNAERATLDDKFSYKSTTVPKVNIQSKKGNNAMSSGTTKVLASKPSIAGRGRMTPLQRLAAGALQKQNLYSGATIGSLNPPPNIQLSTRGAGVGMESVARGSEDTMRSDLHEDSESGLSPDEEDQKESKLDFGRFVFLGQRS